MHAFHAQWWLPDQQLMFIWMKKKLRNVDIPTKEYEIVTITDTQEEGVVIDSCSMDMVDAHMVLETYPNLHNEMIAYGISSSWLTLDYHANQSTLSRSELFAPKKVVEYLIPEYMIAPSIG